MVETSLGGNNKITYLSYFHNLLDTNINTNTILDQNIVINENTIPEILPGTFQTELGSDIN